MNAQMMDSLFIESYLMLNMDISFTGVRTWFEMAGLSMDDVTLFKTLWQPEKMASEYQAEVSRLIIYRIEDVFFQINRTEEEFSEPIHQLLLRTMNTRTLYGEQDAMIDLGVLLMQDKEREVPLYPSLHTYFN
ncbi:hypothetical protein [Paenibacillus sp. MMO-177]|uniref:hypothetical protein n=1 Tax=Paenibacillus sp. MMO-177 TaxID=3081289 RepID=UPI003019E1E4